MKLKYVAQIPYYTSLFHFNPVTKDRRISPWPFFSPPFEKFLSYSFFGRKNRPFVLQLCFPRKQCSNFLVMAICLLLQTTMEGFSSDWVHVCCLFSTYRILYFFFFWRRNFQCMLSETNSSSCLLSLIFLFPQSLYSVFSNEFDTNADVQS